MNLNNLKTGVKLIKEIIANNKSEKAPWHKNNQVKSSEKSYMVKTNKDQK